MAYINLKRVRFAAAPCVANVGQQAGIAIPENFAAATGGTDDIAPEPPSPPWAAETESRIRQYVASRPALGATEVLVRCIEEGCNVTLAGEDIRIFDLQFEVFADQNGFQQAVLGGGKELRFAWLQR
jgi:hypothetical protein